MTDSTRQIYFIGTTQASFPDGHDIGLGFKFKLDY